MHRYTLTVLSFVVLLSISGRAQNSGSKSSDSQHSSSFINAASDSRPREISLGLPTTKSGSVPIFEDGLPVSVNINPLYPFRSWHGGSSAASSSNIGPMETAMRYNEIAYYVYSTSKTGIGDKMGGDVSYTFGHYGQHKLDMNIHGPISNNGWYYSLSAYQNFDPGSNRLSCVNYKDRHQFYKGVLAKEFKDGKGQMSLSLQYVDYFTVNENFGAFVFVGDGSVREMDGFNLGHDQYLPGDTQITFMDLKTGEMVTRDINKDNHCNTFTATFNLSYVFDSNSNLVFRSRYKWADMDNLARTTSSISEVGPDAGFTYADGRPYSGNVQYRNFADICSYEHAWMNNAEYTRRFLPSFLAKFGADLIVSDRGTSNSSANFAHEVCANPRMLYLNGRAFYNFNSSGQFYEGYETKAILYAYYDWRISDKWASEGFIRAGATRINGNAANNVDGDVSNTRHAGFCLKEGKITDVKRLNPEWAAGLNVKYRLSSEVTFNLEPIITSLHPTLSEYCSAMLPSSKASHTILLRGGLTYSAPKFNLTVQLTYLSQDNKIEMGYFSHRLTKDVGESKAGTYESLRLPVVYGISSIGLITDANWNPGGGFSLHGQLMLRNPKYRDFSFNPTFGDGVTEHYDFSGKHITAMPQIELTLDPSYAIKQWRFWLTARYLSREYINKTNSLFFSGRIETFGGIDFTLNKHVKFKLNLVNILNQKGASGSIDSADLVEDTSGYTNYLMSGKFIRPFTVELGVSINL